jgi:hypothetical protein
MLPYAERSLSRSDRVFGERSHTDVELFDVLARDSKTGE